MEINNSSNYNFKKSFSMSQYDFLKIEEDLNLDEKIFEIEKKFDLFKKKSKIQVKKSYREQDFQRDYQQK